MRDDHAATESCRFLMMWDGWGYFMLVGRTELWTLPLWLQMTTCCLDELTAGLINNLCTVTVWASKTLSAADWTDYPIKGKSKVGNISCLSFLEQSLPTCSLFHVLNVKCKMFNAHARHAVTEDGSTLCKMRFICTLLLESPNSWKIQSPGRERTEEITAGHTSLNINIIISY